MNTSTLFIRTVFTLISMLFVSIYTVHTYQSTVATFIGLGASFVFAILIISLGNYFRRFNLRSFNVSVVGLFFGYLMGEALVLILRAILKISSMSEIILLSPLTELFEIAIFLTGLYLGLILTMRASEELYVSIPFVKFTPLQQKKKDLIIDTSALSDPRIIDLSLSGLIDQQVVIPRFIIRELYAQSESEDGAVKSKAKASLEALKKLEEHAPLGTRFNDTDFPEVKEGQAKLVRLAKLIDANIVTADMSKLESTSIEGVRIINLHTLSNALKPLTETGEVIHIKIQRHGKEPNQGVGYLEDGTMVVVNGGGEFIGKVLDVHVLSVKHTSSGRMIFCNLTKDNHSDS